MRVLTITSLFPRSTAPNLGVFILHRVQALARHGAAVRAIAPLPYVPSGPVPSRYAAIRATKPAEEMGGIPVSHPRYFMIPKIGVRMQARGYARGLAKVLAEEVRRFAPDVLDVHYLYPDACGVALAARDLGVPYVCSARGSDVHVLASSEPVRRQIARALAGAAAVIAVSSPLAEAMRTKKLFAGEIHVIPNGVDPERFHPRSQGEARNELGIAGTAPVAVCVGNLVPVQGQELLIRALADPHAPSDLRVFLVGSGPDRSRLESCAATLGVSERVRFVGSVPHEDVPRWFAAADLSVQLNRSAGSPNAVLESRACGRPTLATDIPAMREVGLREEEGELVKPQPEEVARGLQAILDRGLPEGTPTVRTWDDVGAEVWETLAASAGLPLVPGSAGRDG